MTSLPMITDKPQRSDRTPAAYEARARFVAMLNDIGNDSAAVAESLVTGWETTRQVRAVKYPTVDMLDMAHAERVEAIAATIDRILASDSGSYWRGLARALDGGETVESYVRFRHAN